MSSLVHRVALSLCLVGGAGLASAQSPAAVQAAPLQSVALPGSLREALELAISQRPELRAAEQKNTGARQRVLQAAARFYPSLDIGMSARNGRLYDNFSGITATANVLGQTAVIEVARTEPRNAVSSNLRLSYDVYTGGRDSALRRNAQALERSAALEADVLSRDIVREVIVNYLQLLKAYQHYKMALRWLNHAEAREKFSRVRLENGKSSELELLADVQAKAQRRLDLAASRQQLAARYTDYVVSLGWMPDMLSFDPDRLPVLGSGLDAELQALSRGGSLPGALESALADGDIELRKARADREAAQHLIAAERASYAPQVGLYAQYNLNGRSDSDVAKALNEQRRASYEVGVTVSINLFSGFGTQARVSEAQANAVRASTEVDRLELQLQLARSQLAKEVDQALEQERFTRERLELATLRLRVAEAKAGVGREAADGVDAARLELANVRTDIVCSRIDTAMARVKLQFAGSQHAAR